MRTPCSHFPYCEFLYIFFKQYFNFIFSLDLEQRQRGVKGVPYTSLADSFVKTSYITVAYGSQLMTGIDILLTKVSTLFGFPSSLHNVIFLF